MNFFTRTLRDPPVFIFERKVWVVAASGVYELVTFFLVVDEVLNADLESGKYAGNIVP